MTLSTQAELTTNDIRIWKEGPRRGYNPSHGITDTMLHVAWTEAGISWNTEFLYTWNTRQWL